MRIRFWTERDWNIKDKCIQICTCSNLHKKWKLLKFWKVWEKIFIEIKIGFWQRKFYSWFSQYALHHKGWPTDWKIFSCLLFIFDFNMEIWLVTCLNMWLYWNAGYNTETCARSITDREISRFDVLSSIVTFVIFDGKDYYAE